MNLNRYSNDTVLLANSAQGLQRMIDNTVETCNEYSLKLNCKKN